MTARADELDAPITEADGLAEAISTTALALARHFAAGATLWCAAPAFPHHARHVTVEFVHPVVVGARSFPAATIHDLHDLDTLRAQLRAGDVLLVVADPRVPVIDDVLRRCAAWGVASVLLALRTSPHDGQADHVIPVGDERRTLLAYHLLWELTQIVFEHPGLLATPEDPCADDVCITCSDEARIAEVTRTVDDGLAEALDAGRRTTVDVTLLPDIRPGDLVLVHAGLALQRIEGAPA
jgi:hydrogenase maturation factor